jgi:hypothetical protein
MILPGFLALLTGLRNSGGVLPLAAWQRSARQVLRVEAPPRRSPALRLRVTWRTWAVWESRSADDGGDLAGAVLDAAVAAVADVVQDRDAVPREALAADQQGRLVGVDLK